jgi:drug/metabolite transporter (DMT)-like permease
MWLLYAASAACCFGLRGILYQWTSKQPADRNILLFGVYLCGAIIALGLNGALHQAWTAGAGAGLAMGVFSFISNSSMHKGFAVGKASLVALLVGLPPLIVVLAALALWGEKLSLAQSLAFVVILCGGLLIKSAGGLSLRNMKGTQWGLLAMVTFALTDLSSKQATLWGGETLPTLVLMYVTGSLLFGISAWVSSTRHARQSREETAAAGGSAGSSDGNSSPVMHHETAAALENGQKPATLASPDRPAPSWSLRKTMLVGMAVGLTNISGMILMMPAMRTGITGLVSAIIALNALIIMLYARVVLKERFKPLELAGMALSFGGVLALRIFG